MDLKNSLQQTANYKGYAKIAFQRERESQTGARKEKVEFKGFGLI